jgi:hypothetical protein
MALMCVKQPRCLATQAVRGILNLISRFIRRHPTNSTAYRSNKINLSKLYLKAGKSVLPARWSAKLCIVTFANMLKLDLFTVQTIFNLYRSICFV